MKIYIAGPYTKGDTIVNIREAIIAADLMMMFGHIPFVPHLTGFWHLLSPKSYDKWMKYDAEWLKSCDALLRLEGESKGADEEVEIAKSLGIQVYFSAWEVPCEKGLIAY